MIGLNCKFRCFEDWDKGISHAFDAAKESAENALNNYYNYGSGSSGGGGGGYTYYSDAENDSEWEDYFRAEFARQEASKNAWNEIWNAERNLDLLDKQKSFYDEQFDKQNKMIDNIYNNANTMARRTSDNDYARNTQDFQNAARNAADSHAGQYGSWAQSVNNVLDEGWAQQNANNANTLEYNLQDAQDNRDNQVNDQIRNYNNQMLDLETSKMNIDANLKSAIAQNKRNLAGNLASLSEYAPRSQYIGDWGEMLDSADSSGWFKYDKDSIDGVKAKSRDFLGQIKNLQDPTLLDNVKKGDQIAKKLAGYSTDNGTIERLTGSYASRDR